MGYDLNFWAYADETLPRTPEDHQSVYLQLCEGRTPDGLRNLPEQEILASLPGVLQGWQMIDSAHFERPSAAIEILVQPVWVRFDLYGGWAGDDANQLIDLMKSFDCPLFDPQADKIGVRFSLR